MESTFIMIIYFLKTTYFGVEILLILLTDTFLNKYRDTKLHKQLMFVGHVM